MKKRRYIVVPRTINAQKKGLRIGAGNMTFGRKTARWVDDPEVAREIDKEYGVKGSGDVWVAQDENLEWHEKHDGQTDGRKRGVHHYTFGAMTSPAAQEFWKRYEKKKKARKR